MERIKNRLYKHVMEYASGRIAGLRQQMLEMQDSLLSESRSTAGDKHETGRAMIQLELEKLGAALREAELLEAYVQKIPRNKPVSASVALGSLVHCANQWYFLSISAGAYKEGNVTYYCISGKSPVGQQLLGKTVGEMVSLPVGELQIKGIY